MAGKPSKTVARLRARNSVLNYVRPPGHPDLVEARRDLAAEVLAEHVERVLKNAPPLTEDQVGRIVALLQPAGSA